MDTEVIIYLQLLLDKEKKKYEEAEAVRIRQIQEPEEFTWKWGEGSYWTSVHKWAKYRIELLNHEIEIIELHSSSKPTIASQNKEEIK